MTVMRRGVGQRIFSGNLGLTNAFWSAQSGDVITIGPGSYTIKACKNVQGNAWGGLVLSNLTDISVFGYGATINTTNYGTVLSLIGCSNVLIQGLTFIGEMNNVTNYTNASWSIEGAILTTPSATKNVSNIRVRDCTFLNQPDQGISYLLGGAFESSVENCYFENIGRTNSFGGGYGPDGSCISGALLGGSVTGCTATNVMTFYEWDGVQAPVNRIARNLLIADNRVSRIFSYGVCINSGAQGNAINGLIIRNNHLLFDPVNLATYNWGATRIFAPVTALEGYQAGIALLGSTTNCVISGNVIEGVSIVGYTNGNGWQLTIRDTPNPCFNVLVEQNIFRTCGSHAITTGAGGLGNNSAEVFIRGNVFDNCYFPIRPFTGNLTISDNTFSSWPSGTDYGGNQIAAVFITVANNTNLTMRGNMFRATNAACRTVNKLNDLTLKYLDNDEHGPVYMTTPILSAVTSSNMLFRGWGAAVPAFSAQAGSLYSLTTIGTVGNLYVQTNQVGLNGWRPPY